MQCFVYIVHIISVLGINGLNSADVPLSNKQNIFPSCTFCMR